jgi:hypothetical protein
MDDDDTIIFLFLVAAVHQLICAYYLLFDDLPTVKEKKKLLKRKHELAPYKRNVSYRYSPPTNRLVAKNCLAEILILNDPKDSEGLSYSALESPEGLYSSYY